MELPTRALLPPDGRHHHRHHHRHRHRNFLEPSPLHDGEERGLLFLHVPKEVEAIVAADEELRDPEDEAVARDVARALDAAEARVRGSDRHRECTAAWRASLQVRRFAPNLVD